MGRCFGGLTKWDSIDFKSCSHAWPFMWEIGRKFLREDSLKFPLLNINALHHHPCLGIFLSSAFRIHFAFQLFLLDRLITRACQASMSHASMLPAYFASTFHNAFLAFICILLIYESVQMTALPGNFLLIHLDRICRFSVLP